MPQKYTVIISERAGQMLGTHIRFLAQVNKKAAVALKKRFMEEFKSLSSMPERTPFFNEDYIPKNKYHKLYVENWFLVLYQIQDTSVYVDWIVDCRQDYSWLLH